MIPTKQRPAAQQQPQMPEPDNSPRRNSEGTRWWTYAAVAVGAAAITGALVFFLKKDDSNRYDEVEAEAVEYADTIAAPAVEAYAEEYDEICAEEAAPEEIVAEAEEAAPAVEEAAVEEAVSSSVDFDRGTEDLNVRRGHRDEVVVHEEAPVSNEDKTFTSVEQMPQFPGGEAALWSWVANHIKYPVMAQENGVQGRVIVQFVVKKDGSIGDVKVARSKDPDLDKEAIRVVRTFPKFIPGKMNGQPVNVWYTLPVTFKLQGN